MRDELKTKWLKGLRGRKYKQGKSRLKHSGRHCCLGVLCEVDGRKISRWQTTLRDGHIDLLWAIGGSENQDTLMRMNDAGKSFRKIADWIEKNIPSDSSTSTEQS